MDNYTMKGIRMDHDMIAKIEQHARKNGINFSDSVRTLINIALSFLEKNEQSSAKHLPLYQRRLIGYLVRTMIMLEKNTQQQFKQEFDQVMHAINTEAKALVMEDIYTQATHQVEVS